MDHCNYLYNIILLRMSGGFKFDTDGIFHDRLIIEDLYKPISIIYNWITFDKFYSSSLFPFTLGIASVIVIEQSKYFSVFRFNGETMEIYFEYE